MLSYQTMELIPLYINEDPATADSKEGIRLAQTAADDVVFVVPTKCELLMVAALVTVTCAGGDATPEFKFSIRPTGGSDTDRVDAGAGHLKLGTTAAGKVMYSREKEGTILEPGQEVVCHHIAAAGTGAAGQARPFMLVRPLSEEPVNMDAMVEAPAE